MDSSSSIVRIVNQKPGFTGYKGCILYNKGEKEIVGRRHLGRWFKDILQGR